MEIFSERIKELRLENNWSLRNLAERIDVSPVAISRWERGIRLPNIENLKQLAVVFNVTTDYLVGLEN